MLHDIHLAETKGSGIRAMRELMLSHDLLPPTFESSRRPDQFVATFLFHHFLGEADLAWLRAQTTERLSDEEARALVFVREVGAIDNAAYRTINRADTLNASAHLRRLRDLGLLVMRGAGSRTYYVPGPAFVPIRGTSGGGEGVPAGAEAQDSQVEPHNLGLDPHKLRLEPHKLPAQPHKLPRASSADLPPELRRRLEGLGTRPPRHIVEESLIALCAWSPSSARELAGWLNDRDPRELTRTYLRPMVADGRLALTFPEMPNHPEQKYELPDPGSRVDA